MTEGSFPKADGDTWFASEANNSLGVISTVAGEGITAGNIVYLNLADGKAYVSGTETVTDTRADGIALNTVTTGQTVYIQTRGIYTTTSLSAQEVYYLGASGAWSATVSAVRIGVASSTTQLSLNIVQDDRDAVGTIKPYAKSLTGIPSNNLNAFWVECNGQVLSDAESPLNGQTMPALNGTTDTNSKFLRGQTTSGSTGGTATHVHEQNGPYDAANAGSYTYARAGIDTDPAGTIPPYYSVVFIIKVK